MSDVFPFFPDLGVYGFNDVEPLVLAALVSGDPVLLIGRSGTGKTFLLNSISEAMGLEHRHYNASLIAFDDLIGFPYPEPDGSGVRFLHTPATVWTAESVLVDELSRCKPEIQNKFFSLIHERRIQGISLNKLRYRWAAMNPAGPPDKGDDGYEGSEPLDQALADRFAFIIEVPDWPRLNSSDQIRIADPAGEGAVSDDNGRLRDFVAKTRPRFDRRLKENSRLASEYARYAGTFMTEAGFRMSPRRIRLLARNITALETVTIGLGEKLTPNLRKKKLLAALTWSLPHRAWKGNISEHVIQSVHSEAVRLAFKADSVNRRVSEFLEMASLPEKVRMLWSFGNNREILSLALIRFFNTAEPVDQAIFAFCTFPLLESHDLVNAEALNAVGDVAGQVYHAEGKLNWCEVASRPKGKYPGMAACEQTLYKISASNKKRRDRACQLFGFLLLQDAAVSDPDAVEQLLEDTWQATKKAAAAAHES